MTFTVALVIAIGVLSLTQVAAQPRDFLRKISTREVEADLQATLSGLLLGKAESSTLRLGDIEASIWQTFQTMPKNAAGRLAPPAVRYIVHGYFAREHGWLIKGLEPHGMQVDMSHVHEVSIFQDKAPALVEGLLEARQSDRGLALHDIVLMVTVLEQMMFDESVTLLEAAYHLNEFPVEDHIDGAKLQKVLESYIILFEQGSKADLFDVKKHQSLVPSRATKNFAHDTIFNFEFKHRHQTNPFKPRPYSFQSASEVMVELAKQYGEWQNSFCRTMKSALTDLDPAGHGVVPLSVLYAQPKGASWNFQESPDYLRTIGALDETTAGNPKVYITNYVQGPSNCIASSSYYSVCCLSECDHVMTELEHHVSDSAASPEKLLDVIGRLSDEVLPSDLDSKLEAIAAHHDGKVPLHSRLFAQWLHFALPQECPYPSVVQSATALTASAWLDTEPAVSQEERKQHIAAAQHHCKQLNTSSSHCIMAEELEIGARWSDHEFLPVHHSRSASFTSTGVIRAAVQIVAVATILRSALAAWRSMGSTGDYVQKKNDEFALHV